MNARLLLPALLLLAPALAADTIHRIDGKTVTDVQIVRETMSEIVYKRGRNEETLPADRVLKVTYSKKPRLVDEADALLQEGDVIGAIDALDEYVEGQIEKANERRYKWAPAYAAWRTVELRKSLADLGGARDAAVRLIKSFPDSRFVPDAYLAKADAEIDAGAGSQAQKTVAELQKLVGEKGLSKRWELEARLVAIRADDKRDGDARRTDLGIIAREAGTDYPTVKSRAQVTEGEIYLAEADALVDPKKAADLRAKARTVFERIVDDPRVTDATLAAAHTGLGECLFYAGAEKGDKAMLEQAAMHYLRVITLFREESRYVPKALYFAMRCFHLMQDRGRKNDMRRELAALYPGSGWATEAEKIPN